jgi:hypothetical protein
MCMIYRPPSANHEQSPEMRLVLAVFEDGIRAATRRFTGGNRREQRDHLDARAWVQDTDREWPFAFANVCDLLGLDADAVRRRVLLGRVPETDGRRNRRTYSRRAGGRAQQREEHRDSAPDGNAQRITEGALRQPSS